MNVLHIIIILSIFFPIRIYDHAHLVSHATYTDANMSYGYQDLLDSDSMFVDLSLRLPEKLTDQAIQKQLNDIHKIIRYNRQVQIDQISRDISFACYRYRKGIDVIKMLYEKVLALDHHFSSLRTFSDIQELSNPNSYPEFASAKVNFKNSTKKKSTVDLPEFLDNNPFVSVGYTLIASVFGEGNKKVRAAEIEKISCLLDFTISMHSDMKIIYYETDFLRASNKELMQKCRSLFSEYTEAINYGKSLDYCRDNDDWDKLILALDNTSNTLQNGLARGPDKKLTIKMNNLEFSVDRLIKFVENYEDFIYQGEQYYQKFKTIVNSYENKTECTINLPTEFNQLEEEINYSIEKFRTAYNMAELQGSRLRDLMYGHPEDI